MPRSKAQTQQIRGQSREQILSTARRLFAERGYDACRVSDIAHQAGMSQGNVYWYFPSKVDLLKSILVDGFETLETSLAKVAAQPGVSLEKLDNLIRSYIDFSRDEGRSEFFTILITLTAHGGREGLSQLGIDLRQIGYGYHQSVSAVIAQAQAEGVVMQDLDPNLLTMFFFSLFNGLMLTYGKAWMDLPDDMIRKSVLRLLGVTTV